MLEFMRTNSLTSARDVDGFGFIRIWATPPRKLVFLDGASSPYKWYQSCHKSLQMVSEPCPELSRVCGWCSIPQGTKGAVYPCKTSWALKDLIAVFLLHVRRALPTRWREELQGCNPTSSKACVSKAVKMISMEYMSSRCENELIGRVFTRERDC